MTQRSDGTVSLSRLDWTGIVATVLLGIGGQWLLINSRVTTLEANQVNQEKRLDAFDRELDSTERQFLEELRSLRRELKQ